LNPKEIAVSAMEQLNMRFEAVDWIANTRVIGTASVPVIKLEVDLVKLAKSIKDTKEPEVKTLKIDIIFNDLALPRSKDSLSLDVSECLTKRCAGYVRQQIVEHPFLKPLVVVLKKYLSLKNLNNSFMGTVSSYGLVLMILALLEDMKRSEPSLNLEQVVGELAEFNLGKAIANFFFVYGE
jgi:DNA polymerase sigma